MLMLLVTLSMLVTSAPLVHSSDQTAATRSLSIQWADGHVTTRVLKPTGWMWTPAVAKVDGADTTYEGLALAALKVSHVVEGVDVLVTISLLYGPSHKREVPVAAVRVTPGRRVRVDELRARGVEPVTLWIGETPAVFNAPALATVPSSHLAVRVDPLDGVPGYRIVIANDAPQSVTALRLAAYRGEQMVISALRRGDRNHPLVAAKSDYTYELMTSNTRTDGADAAGWATIDRLAITAVLWEDGLVEGEAWPIEQDRRIHATRHKQLATVLQTIAEARSPSDLRAALQRFIEDSDTTSRQLAETVLEDLNTFDRSATSGTPAYRQWLESKAAEYREWLVRIERDLASLPHADSGR